MLSAIEVGSWEDVWLNGALLTMQGGRYSVVLEGAIAVRSGRVAWLGSRADLPADLGGVRVHDLAGRWLSPALVDAHTHVVYAGDRCDEFEARLQGATYAQIAQRGGGIASTVRATRAASEEELFAQSLPRVRRMMQDGVGTLEVKSGYGLDVATEAKMLRVARRLGATLGLTVRTTFLGAHALAPEFAGRASDYVDEVCARMLPALHAEGLVDAVDVFCEYMAFDVFQTRQVFECAQSLGLPVKLHAEQLSDSNGAALVAQFGGLSADHLEYLSAAGIAALKSAGTVATLLPAAFYYLSETQLPPIEGLRLAGVPMAVATDCNPGTAPLLSLQSAMNMACVLFKLTPEEAWAGVTCHAARALGLGDSCGQLAVGMRADFALWQVGQPAQVCAMMGAQPCVGLVLGGRTVFAD